MKTRIFLYIFFLVASVSTYAQKTNNYIYLSGTRFTYPILEKWIAEYKKLNPGVVIKLQYAKQKNDSINLQIVANSSQNSLTKEIAYKQVGRYALLPVVNQQNLAFKKAFRKGFEKDDFKKYFFIDTAFLYDQDKKELPYNVYAPTEQAVTSIAFANHFGFKPSAIKGKKINGDDKYLITAIQKDSTGITFNNPGYIFDVTSRQPLPGVKILPVDVNGDGKLDENEKDISNLDVLTQYLENAGKKSIIPIEDIALVSKKANPAIDHFVNWVLTEGQKYNHEFGFLNSTENPGGIAQNTIR